MASAKVGVIHANNTCPAEFIYQNLQIPNNVIYAAHLNNVQKLLFLGSSCIYSSEIKRPMLEDALLTDILDHTNEPYAIAKISGIKVCESINLQYKKDYRSVMPTNLYGPGDNYHPENNHVVPALIRRFNEAKVNNLDEIVIWGTGTLRREFLYVDDMAEASLFVQSLEKEILEAHKQPMTSDINAGTGNDIKIKESAETLKEIVGLTGKIVFDRSKPGGARRKLLDVFLLNRLGWTASTGLLDGLRVVVYREFQCGNRMNNFSSSLV